MGVDAPVGSCVLSVHAYRCPVCRNGKCFCVSDADAGLVCCVVGMILRTVGPVDMKQKKML